MTMTVRKQMSIFDAVLNEKENIMALRKGNTSAASTHAAPAAGAANLFEQEQAELTSAPKLDDAAINTAPAAEAPLSKAPAKATAPAPAAETAPAAEVPAADDKPADVPAANLPAVQNTAVAAPALKRTGKLANRPAPNMAGRVKIPRALDHLYMALEPLEFGVLPRLVGEVGGIANASDDKTEIARELDIHLVSWNDTFTLSPGTDDEKDRELAKYSDDGETINADDPDPEWAGRSCAEYIAYLQDEKDKKNAALKHYMTLIGIVEGADTDDCDLMDQMVAVQMSPQSRKTFEAFCVQQGVMLARGKATAEGLEHIRITAEKKKNGTNSFTLLKVGPQK